jgi:hypothetical protein
MIDLSGTLSNSAVPGRSTVDLILTNVPFSKKDDCLTWLIRTNIPFLALVPFHTVTKKSFLNDIVSKMKSEEDLQIIIVSGRIRFEKENGERMPKTASFPCVWVARGINKLQEKHKLVFRDKNVAKVNITYV